MPSWTPTVDPDIRRAATLPSRAYHDPAVYDLQRERVFARSWQYVADTGSLKAPGHVVPFTLLEGCLDEPLVLARGDDDQARCLSNVCTHRGALVVEGEGHARGLRCRYHGRKFDLAGRFVSMPEFDEAEGFPSGVDHLPSLPLGGWGPLLFTALDAPLPFDEWIEPVRRRTEWLEPASFRFAPELSREYTIGANWALYVDNYLEGFHVPYIHGQSLTGLDYASYRTETFAWGSVQVGVAKAGETVFEPPADHPDAGADGAGVAGLYVWLFPNLMLNFYPWGLSLNVVRPLGPARTRVSFRSYVRDPALLGSGAGGNLHRVEMEDEEVVESCQRGVRSRLYDRGRFSPRREIGTHHFHTLLDRRMAAGG